MILKPQDILVLLKLVAQQHGNWSYKGMAGELGMSQAEVHAAIKRSLAAGLLLQQADGMTPNIRNLEEFLVHGLRFVFVAERGEMTRGMVTAYAAEPLSKVFLPDGEPPPVWPDPNGDTRGMAFSPLYTSAPTAARSDPALYELLVLVDAIRGGRARERAFAIKTLKQRLENYAQNAEPESRHLDQ